jgi:hypothetical protein
MRGVLEALAAVVAMMRGTGDLSDWARGHGSVG